MTNTNTTRTSLFHTARCARHVLRGSESKWTTQGWGEHLARKTNAYETINSYLKHEGELGSEVCRAACLLMTFARTKDFGLPADQAEAFLAEGRARQARKTAV